jgi:hypothetical protein
MGTNEMLSVTLREEIVEQTGTGWGGKGGQDRQELSRRVIHTEPMAASNSMGKPVKCHNLKSICNIGADHRGTMVYETKNLRPLNIWFVGSDLIPSVIVLCCVGRGFAIES